MGQEWRGRKERKAKGLSPEPCEGVSLSFLSPFLSGRLTSLTELSVGRLTPFNPRIHSVVAAEPACLVTHLQSP
jgi:hypothetical protein